MLSFSKGFMENKMETDSFYKEENRPLLYLESAQSWHFGRSSLKTGLEAF